MNTETTSHEENAHHYRWARRAQEGGRPFGVGGGPAGISFLFGLPDPALFPYAELAAATARVMADPSMGPTALQYGNIQGNPGLLALLAAKLQRDEGLSVGPENLLIGNGSAAVLGLAARALLDEGDVVLVEAPTFPGAMSVLRRSGAAVEPVPMDGEGLNLAAMEALVDAMHVRGARPRMLYTQPTFHNPAGVTTGEAQRGALLALARRYDLMVLEDDAYRDLDYDAQEGPLPPSLYALDREARVIRTGTFSKILAPGVRLGWAVAQPEVVQRMMLVKEEGGSNPFGQQVALEWAAGGRLEEHIAALVDAYRLKRDIMLAALEQYFPAQARWTRPRGGFFVWVTLPQTVDPDTLWGFCREEGVDYMAGERCSAAPGDHGQELAWQHGTHLRLSFSALSTDRIEEGIKRLGRVVRSRL